MKLIVNGAAGHMGQALCALIDQGRQGARLAAMVDRCPGEGMLSTLADFQGEADCIVDFSHHAATKELTDYAVARCIPLVVATTGQTEEETACIHRAAETVPLFFSANMSLGVAVLASLVKQAAAMFPDADIEIVEQHHNRKLDVPSGTALMLGRAVCEARPDASLVVGRHENGKRDPREVGIHSLRMGNTVGVHEVYINTGTEILTLRHEAQDRALFAAGALSAAAFLQGKIPGLYNMEDLTRVI